MNQPSKLDIQKAKASLAAMDRTARDLTAELGIPAESRYDVLRLLFEPNPSKHQAGKGYTKLPDGNSSSLLS